MPILTPILASLISFLTFLGFQHFTGGLFDGFS